MSCHFLYTCHSNILSIFPYRILSTRVSSRLFFEFLTVLCYTRSHVHPYTEISPVDQLLCSMTRVLTRFRPSESHPNSELRFLWQHCIKNSEALSDFPFNQLNRNRVETRLRSSPVNSLNLDSDLYHQSRFVQLEEKKCHQKVIDSRQLCWFMFSEFLPKMEHVLESLPLVL